MRRALVLAFLALGMLLAIVALPATASAAGSQSGASQSAVVSPSPDRTVSPFVYLDPGGGSQRPECNADTFGLFWPGDDGYWYQCVLGQWGYEWVNTGERWNSSCGVTRTAVDGKQEALASA